MGVAEDWEHYHPHPILPPSRGRGLCLSGFANFGSLGILIGGMAAMVPERRDEIGALGLRSIVAGTLATLMTGAVVGMLVAAG